jgi:hypothetical protein
MHRPFRLDWFHPIARHRGVTHAGLRRHLQLWSRYRHADGASPRAPPQWQAELNEAGTILASGPLDADPQPGGLLVLSAADRAEVETAPRSGPLCVARCDRVDTDSRVDPGLRSSRCGLSREAPAARTAADSVMTRAAADPRDQLRPALFPAAQRPPSAGAGVAWIIRSSVPERCRASSAPVPRRRRGDPTRPARQSPGPVGHRRGAVRVRPDRSGLPGGRASSR